MIDRTLDDDACYVSIRSVKADPRSAARAAYSRFRIFMGHVGRVNLVQVFGRNFCFNLYFNVMYYNRPHLDLLYALFGWFVIFRSCGIWWVVGHSVESERGWGVREGCPGGGLHVF